MNGCCEKKNEKIRSMYFLDSVRCSWSRLVLQTKIGTLVRAGWHCKRDSSVPNVQLFFSVQKTKLICAALNALC